MVTRSDNGAGVSPARTLPKLRLERSSEIESIGATSTSTAALAAALAAGVAAHPAAAADELRGDGGALAKSVAFAFVSLQPEPARTAAVVALSAGAGPAPS